MAFSVVLSTEANVVASKRIVESLSSADCLASSVVVESKLDVSVVVEDLTVEDCSTLSVLRLEEVTKTSSVVEGKVIKLI